MNFTQWFVVFVTAALLIFDGVNSLFGLPSESTVIRQWAWSLTLIPFSVGCIIGHWFFPGHGITNSAWGNCLPFMVLLLGFDLLWMKFGGGVHPWYRYPGWYFVLGVPVGMLVWGAPL